MGAIKALRGAIGVLMCLVLGLSLWLTVERQVFHREELALPWAILRPVAGDAMAPHLEDGDLALAVALESYGPGDALLCGDGAIRRAVGSVEDQLIARGDQEDPEAEVLLAPEDISGKVLASLPGAGHVYWFLSSLWAPPLVLAVGLLLFFLPAASGLTGRGRTGHPQEEGFPPGGGELPPGAQAPAPRAGLPKAGAQALEEANPPAVPAPGSRRRGGGDSPHTGGRAGRYRPRH